MDRTIFLKPECLSATWTPDRLLHRESDQKQILDALSSDIRTVIIGPFGSGKTSLVKKAREAFNKKGGHAVFVDCSVYQTSYSVLKEVLPRSDLVFYRSNYELIRELRKYAAKNSFTIVFDSFDQLKEKDILLKLMSLGISMMLVTESEQAFRELDTRITSNIPHMLRIQPYTDEQTYEILKQRADISLAKWAYRDELLREVANRVGGNVTLGINALKAAAVKAQARGSSIELQDVHIENSNNKLTADERALLDIIRDSRSIQSRDLYGSYVEQVPHPKSMRAYRNYMQSLCSKGLVRAVGDRKGRVYEFAGGGNVQGYH